MLGVPVCLAVLNTQDGPPQAKSQTGPVLMNDLSRVPQVCLELLQGPSPMETRRHIAVQIEKINHLNAKKMDGFLVALRGELYWFSENRNFAFERVAKF